jgi:hypothetical protein
MVVARMDQSELLAATAVSLRLNPAQGTLADDAFLAALLRRSAGALCPCSPATLVSSVADCLQPFAQASVLRERLDDVVEHLIVMGDFLELGQVTIDNSDVKGTWVFIGPPSFVARPNGGAILSGISPDELTPLPASLLNRVRYEGVARIIDQDPQEDLPMMLRDLGFVELSPKRWLRAPTQLAAGILGQNMRRRLAEQPASGAIPDLIILDPSQPVTHYRKRWAVPSDQTGSFVARRPQAYGAPLWGFVELEAGNPKRFLDFPLNDFLFRGCDVGWYLQMAIDANHGTPQRYRKRAVKDGTCLDFFSPLPLWAGRRLRILGRSCQTDACLVSYFLTEKELGTEERFLQQNLWLSSDDGID